MANSLGLLLGGIVTERWGWRVLFLGPFVPVGAALFLAVCVLPSDPRSSPAAMRQALRAFDWTGTAVFSSMMVLLLYGINRGGAETFTQAIVAVSLALAALLLPVLVAVERRALHPILPPALVCARPIALALGYSFIRDTTYMVKKLLISFLFAHSFQKRPVGQYIQLSFDPWPRR